MLERIQSLMKRERQSTVTTATAPAPAGPSCTGSTHPRHNQAQAMVQAQHRLLAAFQAEGMPIVFPVSYQIQMGETWEQTHPGDLTTDYNGQPLNIGSYSASLFSAADQTDIRTYYKWAYQQSVVLYRDIIMIVNLSDEPQGADYLVHAVEVFRQR